MKKLVFFMGLILFAACANTSKATKPTLLTTDYDTTNYTVIDQKFLKSFDSHESIKAINSTQINVTETFCDITSKDTLKCISNKVAALTQGSITKIIKQANGNVKTIVVAYPEKNYVYNCYFFRTKDAYGSEQFVLSGEVDLFFKGKIYKINASTVGICKLLTKK